ncbi:MAG TPA: LutB/LldF family L-lactate oxidation iron-sulfur protein [Acidimicrobiia bacterium]|jgi:L-lactate dehydrogenase complex protein LldF
MTPVTFRERSVEELGTSKVVNIGKATRRKTRDRLSAAAAYPPMEEMRDRARAIRLHTLRHLSEYLAEFADSVERRGGHVYFAADADEANAYVSQLAADRGVRTIVKSKSMVTEEIELNHHLESQGLEVVETDLGEFIIQIAGERPSHIISPVMHKDRYEVAELFAAELDMEYSDDPVVLNAAARRHLRSIFLAADMGISGVNFGVADTGTITTVTNEGNARLTTTAPRIHVAIMGMERLVPNDGDLTVMLEVLGRSGTGQALTVYTNLITGPRSFDEQDGPDELHVVILDNGRSKALASSSAEILACIRCGACLNVCPVFREAGGHAYGSVYTGPIGAVLTPALFGHDEWGDLPFASSLCGACKDACPIRIDIPSLLLEQRAESMNAGGGEFGWLEPGMAAYRRIATNPMLWRGFLAAGGVFGRATGDWVTKLPFQAGNWTSTRDLPSPATQSFHSWWKEHRS